MQGHEVDFYRGCADKLRFASKRKAEGKRIDLMDKAGSYERFLEHEKLNVYKCKAKGAKHWHLGKGDSAR